MSAPGWKSSFDTRVLALGFLLGVIAVHALPRLIPWQAFLLAAPFSFIRWPLRPWLLAGTIGAALATCQAVDRLNARLPASDRAQDLWLAGEVAGLPERRGGDWRFLFAPDEGELQRVRVTWYRSDGELRAGECWRFLLRLKPPRGLMNPGGFDYEAWLFRENIGATGYVREAERCPKAVPGRLGALQRGLLQLRQAQAGQVTARLTDHPLRGFVLGLTLGDTSAIGDAQWRVLRRTGTTHLLSISGLHITLAAGFVFFLVRWLWACWPRLCLYCPAQRGAAGCAMLAAFAYALLAGFSIPTQRALVMLLVVMTALLASRQLVPSRLLSLALLAVLLMDTAAVLYPGFWLSFGAVAWLLYSLTARVGPMPRWQLWLQPQAVLALALVPPCLFWFGEFSLASPVANSLMIPLFSLLIPWLLVAVVLVGTAIGDWMLSAGVDGLALAWRGLVWLAAQPGAYWTWVPPSAMVLCLAMLGLLLALAPRGLPGRPLGLVLCVPVFLSQPSIPPPGHFDFALLDVGQGLSAVIRTQRHSLLFDAGPAYPSGLDTGEAVVVPYLRQKGIRRLDRLILSHGDLDHRGGVNAVRGSVPIDVEIGTDRGRPCRAGARWEWDGVQFELLHPDGGGWSDNDSSCVLRVKAGRYAVLLTGDIQRRAETRLLETARGKLRADVIVVPHHGSGSSSTGGFVSAVAADLALVPSGWANRWGFPKPEVVERYRAAGAEVVITGNSGALQFRMSPVHGVQALRRWREQSRRIWRAG